MPNIFKYFSSSSAEAYVFPEVALTEAEPEEQELPEGSEQPEEGEESGGSFIDYANVQADAIVQDAHREAEELLERAREEARKEAEAIYQEARESGRQDGYADGLSQALEEGAREREKQAAQMADEVQRFLDRAGAALDRQMDENLDDLRDLAIAIAEKVICVSLRSSTEIIGRMVQTALDKHKHREWVHIYIAESDIKRMGELPASLTSAISALSDRVRIVPMADDESGTCVIEMPDEIIDASVSTQLGNIRSLLSDSYQDENEMINFSF